MFARVLGPLEVELNGTAIAPTAPKPRKVLTLLVLHANQIVPSSALKRELWDEEAPVSASTTIQTYILLLRKQLMRAAGGSMATAKAQLVTCPGGYQLRNSGGLDLHAFDRLCTEGRQALARGEDERASSTLRAALALWRGPALCGVQLGPLLEVEALRLQESRIVALEQRIEADLRLGRHHELISELTSLVGEFPLHENLHAQLMLALYRSGRKPHALDVHQRLRSRFIDELGLEPSARMYRLHQAIIVSDPALDAERRSRTLLLDRFAGHAVAS
ncbi:BTAD domain-containing putative transcriptional regulator [Kitasatospora phosalacinea]|uniref:BTAD domain-containing putative transcriptional regulator n=1 Tax=Kitasatospora phosalacinea TaxID=2065 RepID=A0ABW6GGZ8_9ACTN